MEIKTLKIIKGIIIEQIIIGDMKYIRITYRNKVKPFAEKLLQEV